MEQLVYLNGTLLPREQARISPFDLGFLYGYALFETMRVYSGNIFRLRQHLERLTGSARLLGLPLGNCNLEEACIQTLEANKLSEARIRLTVSIGEGEGIPDPPAHPEPTVLIVASSYTPLSPDVYKSGFRTIISTLRQNSQSPVSRMKSANYLIHMLARKEAREAGADEALLLNERSSLCEGSTSNLFIVRDGCLITPGEDSGCLPGITRRSVIELSSASGIGVVERDIQPDELQQAQEVFATNSLLEIMPIREVDGRSISEAGGKDVRGPITRRLMTAYGELVAGEGSFLP
jgi:branched-chain amino acid aminotransferase